VKVINPASLPKNAFDPLGAKMKEFGELGSALLLPTVLLLVEMGYTSGWHPGIGTPVTVLHCDEVA
jgi:hypothetical protein